LDVEKIRKRRVSGFTSSNLTMVAHAFDFMVNLNTNCWMSREAIDNISGTYTSLLPNFLGVAEGNLNITFKYLLKLFSTSDYSQYCWYIIAKLSMMPWARNLIYNSSTRHLAIATTHIQFVDSTQLKKNGKKSKLMK
jgi:hypothetical protein